MLYHDHMDLTSSATNNYTMREIRTDIFFFHVVYSPRVGDNADHKRSVPLSSPISAHCLRYLSYISMNPPNFHLNGRSILEIACKSAIIVPLDAPRAVRIKETSSLTRLVIAWAYNGGAKIEYWKPLHIQIPQIIEFINAAKEIPDEITPYIYRIRQSLVILVKDRERREKHQYKGDCFAKQKKGLKLYRQKRN